MKVPACQRPAKLALVAQAKLDQPMREMSFNGFGRDEQARRDLPVGEVSRAALDRAANLLWLAPPRLERMTGQGQHLPLTAGQAEPPLPQVCWIGQLILRPTPAALRVV